MTKKYFLITYGCQMNVSDSERIASVLEKTGYKPALKIEQADLIVVNMCSVRQSAVDRVYGNIKNFRKLRAKIVLTGCITNYDFKKLKNKFDYILSIKDLVKDGNYLKIKPEYTTKFSAYIPVTIGCNNFCTYCVVPYTRGPEISRPVKDILKEIKEVIKKEYKEIWLLGENVNSYKYKKINFPKLLKMIDDIPGNFWIRFTSSHPKDFSDELIETIAKGKKITHYINLPVQSGDDKILKRMNRPYSLKEYKNLVKKIKKEIPDAFLSTDVIVGFPEETKKQFQNTVKLFEELKFDMAYIAQYSARPGTAAFKMKDDISFQEKEKREKFLTEKLKKTALEKNKKYIGKIVEVLPQYERKGWLVGKTKEYRTIKFKISRSPTSRGKSDFDKLIGKFVKVKVTDAIPWGLSGRLWRPKLKVKNEK